MKTKNIITPIIFMSLTIIANAQPLPPDYPSGKPVPVEGLLVLLPVALGALGILKLRKKKS